MKQYDIYRANLPLPIGRRPVLLLSRAPAYVYLNKVIVVEVTSTTRGIPQEVPIGAAEGLARASVANFDNIHVIPTVSLRKARRNAREMERTVRVLTSCALFAVAPTNTVLSLCSVTHAGIPVGAPPIPYAHGCSTAQSRACAAKP